MKQESLKDEAIKAVDKAKVAVQHEAKVVKKAVVHASYEAQGAANAVHHKAEEMTADIKHGMKDMKHSIDKTSKKATKEIEKSLNK